MGLLYNFRGIAGEDLTPDIALKIGNLAADFFLRGNVAVGSDHRTSSPMLKSALIAGLISKGCEVVDYGLLPTPVVAYLTKVRHDGGSMITASHNPPEWNGIKFFNSEGLVFGPEEENEMKNRMSLPLEYESWEKISSVSIDRNGLYFYLKSLLDCINLGSKELKIVVDAGGGVGALAIPRLLEEMGFQVVKLNCTLDPFFKGRPPEPRPENLLILSRKIREENADLGFAYDGDCDRIVIYDDRGRYVPGNLGMIFLADQFVPKGSKIVVNVTGFFGMKHFFGGKYHLIPEKWGQTFLQRRMKEEESIFGGEPDGHYMWPGFFQSYADAIFSTAKVVEAISNIGEPLSEVLSRYPSLHLLRVKSKPWSGSFQAIRDKIIAFMERPPMSGQIYADIDSHLLYSETDTMGLTIRQSHWDRTVRIEIETLALDEAENVLEKAYLDVLKPEGVVIPDLEMR